MLWSALLMYITGAGSRNQFDCIADDSEAFAENLARLCKSILAGIPTTKATANYLEQVDIEGELSLLASLMVNRMIRSKMLESARLLDQYYPIAIDMTGWLSFASRHCENCIVHEHRTGTRYYHHAEEAKLVTPDGFALSIATEFVENTGSGNSKQDCELKAFPRLLKKIRSRFPRLPICLLLDGIYPSEPMMALCREHDMQWIASFKEGHLPTAFQEFLVLKQEAPENVREHRENGQYHRISWLGDLRQGDERFQAFDCHITDEQQNQQYFAFCTSLPVTHKNCVELVNHGGRMRWKIENEGFNVQKNGNLQMEHIYSHNLNAAKAYYLLLQVAHILIQLIWKGSLLKAARKRLHSMKNLFARLTEHLRNKLIPDSDILMAEMAGKQIRMDST
jgi:hypothetical protein